MTAFDGSDEVGTPDSEIGKCHPCDRLWRLSNGENCPECGGPDERERDPSEWVENLVALAEKAHTDAPESDGLTRQERADRPERRKERAR